MGGKGRVREIVEWVRERVVDSEGEMRRKMDEVGRVMSRNRMNHKPNSKCENTRVLDSMSDGSQGWLLLCHVTICDDED